MGRKVILSVMAIFIFTAVGFISMKVFNSSEDSKPVGEIASEIASEAPNEAEGGIEKALNSQDKMLSAKEENKLWAKRCDKDSKHCEIFQRIIIKESQKRLVEVALGYVDNEIIKGRLAIILPLGLDLPSGVTIKIPKLKDLKIPIKTCLENGCFALSDISLDSLDAMKDADEMTVILKGSDGKPYNIIMSLVGFAQALKQIP